MRKKKEEIISDPFGSYTGLVKDPAEKKKIITTAFLGVEEKSKLALEVEKANDNSASRIRELEQDIVDKEKEVSVIKFKAEE